MLFKNPLAELNISKKTHFKSNVDSTPKLICSIIVDK